MCARQQVFDHRLHLGVIRLADEAERRRQVAGADENAIHAIDPRDRIDRFHTGTAFDLHHHRDVLVNGGEVIGNGAVAIIALRNRETATHDINVT